MISVSKTNHEEFVNSFIPVAEKRAIMRVKELDSPTELRNGEDGPWMYDFFTLFFHQEMDAILKEEGLRV
jgi:hypothetical protein